MAEPIRFCGFNKTWGVPKGSEDRLKPLHVFANGNEQISCWKLTPEEIAEINRTGEIWQSSLTPAGSPFHPVYVSGIPMMEAFDMDTGLTTTYHSDGKHMVEDARRFATLHHGDQEYGPGLPYTYHLGKVVAILRELNADWPYLVAGWGHDLEEDCWQDEDVEARRARINARFGPLCEALIWCCTGVMYIDGVKQTRKQRNQQQYDKIAEFLASAPVKGADRTANMEACVEFESSQGPMYFDEVLEFDAHVGIHCPIEIRVRIFEAAVGIHGYAAKKCKADINEIKAKLAEIKALIPQAA